MTLFFLALEFLAISVFLLGAARIGMGAVLTVVASLQFFQAILGGALFWEVGQDLLVSPGSSIFFASNLAILLYVYIKGGAVKARRVFYTIVGANIVVAVLSALIAVHIHFVEPVDLLNLPSALFGRSLAASVVGVVVLAVAQLIALAVYNLASRKGVPVPVAMSVALVAALSFDTVGYLTPLFWSEPNFSEMLQNGLISKSLGGIAFGLVWGGYSGWRGATPDEEFSDLIDELRFVNEGGLKARVSGRFGLDYQPDHEFDQWFNRLPDPVCVVVNERLELANERFAETYVFDSPEQARGTPIEQFMSTDVLDVFRAGRGEGEETIVRHMLHDGRQVDTAVVRFEFRDHEAYICVTHPVTKRLETDEDKERTGDIVSAGAIAAGVAHEVNNPLAFVTSNQGFAADTLRGLRGKVDPSLAADVELVLESLEDASDGAERVRRVIAQLMSFARADSGKFALCDVNAAIESRVEMVREHLTNSTRLVVNAQQLPQIQAAPSLLEELLSNLLMNAIHAVEEVDRDAHEIELTARNETDAIVISVRDTGAGIPEELRSKIMAPFFTTKVGGKGTGLGLATSQSIVRAMGGELDFESEVGVGSTFRVTLPLGSEPVAPAEGVDRGE